VIGDLDDHLRAHRHTETVAAEQSAPPSGGWVEIR
jgi:hypothetical protein